MTRPRSDNTVERYLLKPERSSASILKQQAAWIVLALLIVGYLVANFVVRLATGPRPAPQTSPTVDIARPVTQPERPWRAALQNGDGADWFALTDRDRAVLCLQAAKALEQDKQTAETYHLFLDGFYREPNPTTRSRKIAETLAVCQALIEKGTVEVDR
ncbi:MAG: hypothetical protein ABIP48_08365 [Planctomycetota bacterium]